MNFVHLYRFESIVHSNCYLSQFPQVSWLSKVTVHQASLLSTATTGITLTRDRINHLHLTLRIHQHHLGNNKPPFTRGHWCPPLVSSIGCLVQIGEQKWRPSQEWRHHLLRCQPHKHCRDCWPHSLRHFCPPHRATSVSSILVAQDI